MEAESPGHRIPAVITRERLSRSAQAFSDTNVRAAGPRIRAAESQQVIEVIGVDARQVVGVVAVYSEAQIGPAGAIEAARD